MAALRETRIDKVMLMNVALIATSREPYSCQQCDCLLV